MDKILFRQHWRRSSAERHGCFVYFCQFSCVFLFKTAGCHFLYFRPLWLQRGPAVVILALCVLFVVVSPKTVFIYIYTPWFEPCPAGEDWPDSCLLLHLKLLLVLCTLTFLLKLQIKIFSIFTLLGLSQALCLLYFCSKLPVVIFCTFTHLGLNQALHYLSFASYLCTQNCPLSFFVLCTLFFVVVFLKLPVVFHPPWLQPGPADEDWPDFSRPRFPQHWSLCNSV